LIAIQSSYPGEGAVDSGYKLERRLGKISLGDENARSRVKRVNPTLRMRHFIFSSMIDDRLWFSFEMIRGLQCLFEARVARSDEVVARQKLSFAVCKAGAKGKLEERCPDKCCKLSKPLSFSFH
jgi:hypothetical protein